jgi:hypothetical protein
MGAKPLGVKLHEPLCLALSQALLSCVAACEAASGISAPVAHCMLRAVVFAGTLGASMQVCACTPRC